MKRQGSECGKFSIATLDPARAVRYGEAQDRCRAGGFEVEAWMHWGRGLAE